MPKYRIVFETENTVDGAQSMVDIDTDLPLYSASLGTWYDDRVLDMLRQIGKAGGYEKVALVHIMEAVEDEE